MLKSDNISKYFTRVLAIYNQMKDGRDTCGRKDHTLASKKVSLNGSRDKGVVKYGCFFNKIQEDVGAQTLLSK
jgi:hypothetical protein